MLLALLRQTDSLILFWSGNFDSPLRASQVAYWQQQRKRLVAMIADRDAAAQQRTIEQQRIEASFQKGKQWWLSLSEAQKNNVRHWGNADTLARITQYGG
jgi:hypothetical protein